MLVKNTALMEERRNSLSSLLSYMSWRFDI